MKVALVSFGHVDVVLPLVKNLRNRDVEVELILCFALNRKSESILDFTNKKVETGFLSKEKIDEILPDGIKKYLADISSVNFFIFFNLKFRSFRNLLLSIKFSNKLKNYDIVHFNGINGVLPFLIFFLRRKKLVFTIHDIHSHSSERTRFNFAEKMSRYILRSKFPVIVQNISDFGAVKDEYFTIKDKFRFIPFGVLDIYQKFEKADHKSINSDLLFFGRISRYKGIEYLVSSLETLKEKGISVKTIIAGKGKIYFDTGNLNKLGIVLINQYIPNSELVSLIKGTKVVICPYTDATQSGVVMTAFAFNKPVIASIVGNFPEMIKDGINGFLVPPKNKYELALKIKQLITDTALLEQMQNNIQSITTSGVYSWSQIVMKMQELYASILSKRSNN